MSGLFDDLRFAARGLLRNGGFTATAVATLAVGMGATTAVFALLNGLLLRPLPVERQAELVEIALHREDGSGGANFSWPQYHMLRELTPGLAGLAAFGDGEYGVAVPGGEPEFVPACEVSANYFGVLGVQPAAGRFFSDEVEQPGGEFVVVLSHDYAVLHFGTPARALGATLLVNAQPMMVIGVAPADFRGTTPMISPRLWLPVTALPTLSGVNIAHPGMAFWLTLVGRLAPGTSADAAESMLSGRVRSLEGADLADPFTATMTRRAPAAGVTLARLRAVPAAVAGAAFGFMGLLFLTAALVLLIAAVNITSMMLARSTARSRELGVRRSLGATRGHLMRLVLTENVLLFVAGAAVGLVLAMWLAAAIPALAGSLVERTGLALDVQLELPVVAFAFGTALLLGLAFGLPAALHASGGGMLASMREGASPRRGTRLRSGFVVAQIALSLVLLITAALLGRALQSGLATDPGFDASGVAVAELDLRPYGYDAAAARQLHADLLGRLEARGEIEVAGLTNVQPLQGWMSLHVRPEGLDEVPEGGVLYQAVDGGYLRGVRVPLRAGRYFDERDRSDAPPVAIVNEAFAQRFWPGRNPIGRHIFHGPPGNEAAIQVVGVVATGRYRSLTEDPQPFFYLPINQRAATAVVVTARGPAGTAELQRLLRAEIRALEPGVPVRTASLERAVGIVLTPQRVAATAIGGFGLIGLLLAGIGVYGLVAFTAAQRAREVGVRIALGAARAQVVLLFLRQGARMLAIGTLIGLAAAFGGSRLLGALLHGVSPTDPLTWLAVPAVLATVALLAAYLPARRASRTDPMNVLRGE